MAKKKLPNKEEKIIKVESPKESNVRVINWNEMPSLVYIIGLKGKHIIEGKEVQVNKEIAQVLVEKGVAKLK